MCLITHRRSKPIIARNDIKVKKVLTFKIRNKTLCSPFFGLFEYKLNVLYKTNILEINRMEERWKHFDPQAHRVLRNTFPSYSTYERDETIIMCLTQGFHSMSLDRDYSIYISEKDFVEERDIMVECTIPKGSKYYRDPSKKLLVSNQIIINKVFDKYSKYL